MKRCHFFLVTALAEGGTGLLLLGWPSIPLALLLGVDEMGHETAVIARILGAALLAVGVACWLAMNDPGSRSQVGLLVGVLIYDVSAAGLLAHAGLALKLGGPVLWPAVAAHAALALWCVVAFGRRDHT